MHLDLLCAFLPIVDRVSFRVLVEMSTICLPKVTKRPTWQFSKIIVLSFSIYSFIPNVRLAIISRLLAERKSSFFVFVS